jgi:hypothetical protein
MDPIVFVIDDLRRTIRVDGLASIVEHDMQIREGRPARGGVVEVGFREPRGRSLSQGCGDEKTPRWTEDVLPPWRGKTDRGAVR